MKRENTGGAIKDRKTEPNKGSERGVISLTQNEPDSILQGKKARVVFADGKSVIATINAMGRYWVLLTVEEEGKTRRLIVNKSWIAYYEVM